MKRVLLTGVICTVFLAASCKDKPTVPPIEEKVHLEQGKKYLCGDVVWVHCGSNVNASNAIVAFNYNRTDNNEWESLPVLKREGSDLQVALPTNDVTVRSEGYSKLIAVSGTDTSHYDSLTISALLLTTPADADTLKVNDNVRISWRVYLPKISGVLISMTADNGLNWTDLLAELNRMVPKDSFFTWTVGDGVVDTVDYTNARSCKIRIEDYTSKSEYNDQNKVPFVVVP